MSGMFDPSVLDYQLPDELKCNRPGLATWFDGTRMLVFDRKTGKMEIKNIQDLPDYFNGEPVYANNAKLDKRCNHLYRTECHWAKELKQDGEGTWAVPSAGLPIDLILMQKLNLKHITLFTPEQKTLNTEQMYRTGRSEIEEFIIQDPFDKPVYAIGTTAVKALESFSNHNCGPIRSNRGWSDLLIVPGYVFKNVKGFLTNFHYAKEPLMAMVAAFTGVQECMEIYNCALKEKMRFIDFGDRLLVI
jgi:S-adenosylmethionine:tRNA-ribosyltransferase-isomerase (queuine synthetase)